MMKKRPPLIRKFLHDRRSYNENVSVKASTKKKGVGSGDPSADGLTESGAKE